MPIQSTSIIPYLFKQILNKYSQNLDQLNQEQRDHKYKELLIELYAIFGDILKSALRLLDEQQFIVYGLNPKLREVVEIAEHRNSAKVIKIYPGVNFCTCDYFALQVLNLSSSTLTESNTSSASSSYTCAHVLAMHLVKLLELPGIRKEILSKHNFNFILSGMTVPESP